MNKQQKSLIKGDMMQAMNGYAKEHPDRDITFPVNQQELAERIIEKMENDNTLQFLSEQYG